MKMHGWGSPWVLALALGLPIARADAGAGGEASYREHCAFCHGAEGRGDGPAATKLSTPPADFTSGNFKLRSTSSGELPTDEDLFGTITRGIPGTAMPSFADLPPAERRELVETVKRLSRPRRGRPSFFTVRPPNRVIVVPPRPEPSGAAVAGGKELYQELGCGVCHGPQGRGDGSAAKELKDARGRPIRPRDFTLGIFKSGSDPRGLYLRIATGLNGTPMAEYGDDLMTPKQRWALVEYVLSLVGK